MVDKWHGGSRLPTVLHELAWRFEGLLEIATRHDATYRRNQGIQRRLAQIVTHGLIETRELISATAKDPRIFASSALEDCSIPERDELLAMVRADPKLKTLRQMIVPSDQPDVVESDEDQGGQARDVES